MADKDTVTVIGPDAHIKGEMTFPSSARVLGSIEGSITAKSELHVAEGSVCKASIDAAKVTVDGRVHGNVTASERVELNASAHVEGDLDAAKLVVVEGATFIGHCRIGVNGKANGVAAPAASTATSPSAALNGAAAASSVDDDDDSDDGSDDDTKGEVRTRGLRAKATASRK